MSAMMLTNVDVLVGSLACPQNLPARVASEPRCRPT